MRRTAPSRHLDRAAVGAVVRDADGRIWGGTGVVYKPTDAESHLVTATGKGTRVHVKLGTEELPLRCLMACLGVFRTPEVGDLVPIFVPGGDVSDERMGPVAFLGLTDQELPEGQDLRDVVLLARTGGKVRLGAATGTTPLARADRVEARLTRLETQARYIAPTGGGLTSTAVLPSLEYLAAHPLTPAPTLPNGPHVPTGAPGEPAHVHYAGYDGHEEDEPSDNATTPTAGDAIALAVEGI